MTETNEATTRPSIDVLLSSRPTSKKQDSDVAKASSTEEKSLATKEAKESTEKASQTEKKADESAETSEKTVPLKALQESRMKNRELKNEVSKLREELEALKTGSDKNTSQYWTEEHEKTKETPMIPDWYAKDRLIRTVNEVRRERQDADKLFEAFDKFCDEDDQGRVPGAISLWDRAYSSADPGHFIVDYVEQRSIQEKYGADPKTMKEKIRAELESEVTEKVAQKLKGKYNIKDQLPTDIGGSRAAGGGEQPYNRPTPQDLYGRRRKQFFKRITGGS